MNDLRNGSYFLVVTLQVAKGEPGIGNGPLRLGVMDIKAERNRLIAELGVEWFEIYSRKEVPVRWATFVDPWGNQIGLFEYFVEKEKDKKMQLLEKRA